MWIMGGQPSHTAISPLPRGKTVLITGGNTGKLLEKIIFNPKLNASCLTLCVVMESSCLVDTTNLAWFIVYIERLQLHIYM